MSGRACITLRPHDLKILPWGFLNSFEMTQLATWHISWASVSRICLSSERTLGASAIQTCSVERPSLCFVLSVSLAK